MYAKLSVLLLSISLGYAAVPLEADVGLMRFMMHSRALTQDNPTRSLSCFDYYIPELNAIAEKYKADYAQCLDDADESRSGIDESTQPDRDLINESANSSCAALQKCSTSEGAIDFFSCYSEVGGENAKSMYTISSNSSVILAAVREEYRLIEISQFVCTNQSDRVYVEDTARTYEELNRCVAGLAPVPDPSSTPQPSTPEPSSPEPSSPEPSSPEPTTPEPSSSEPSTPEQSTPESSPEPSSPEPSSPEPSSPEPSSPEPSSLEPSSPEQSTPEDSTSEETSPEPSAETPAPSESTSEADSTEAPSEEPTSQVSTEASENLPEEDIDSQQHFDKWLDNLINKFRRF